ncbi:MAG: hypothetical protein MJ252_03410 [archaeon]|nr:hypothetical protein [archaeon]
MNNEISKLLSINKVPELSDEEEEIIQNKNECKTPNPLNMSHLKTRENIIFSPIIGNNNYFNKEGTHPIMNNKINQNTNSNGNSVSGNSSNSTNPNFLSPNSNKYYGNINTTFENNINTNTQIKQENIRNNEKMKYFNSLSANQISMNQMNQQLGMNAINPQMNIPQQINSQVNFQSPYIFSTRTYSFAGPNNTNINFSPIGQSSVPMTYNPYMTQNQNRIFQSPDINKGHREIKINNFNQYQNIPQNQMMNQTQPMMGSPIRNYPMSPTMGARSVVIGNNPHQQKNINDEIILNNMLHKNKKLKKTKTKLEEMAIIQNNTPVTVNPNPMQMNINQQNFHVFNNQMQRGLNTVSMIQNVNLTPNLGASLMNPNIQINNPNLTPNPSNTMLYSANGKLNPNPTKEEESNKINLDSILMLQDKRTTLMIKNIPNKYTINTFLDEINVDFKGKYDIFYLPIDYGNKCNLGFAFINFVEPLHIILFYDLYRGKKWKRFNSEKICELVYAKIQGKKDLIAHFEKGKVLSFESEEKRPLILQTPNPLPYVRLPIKVFDKFRKLFPYSRYTFYGNTTNPSDNPTFLIESLSGQ